MLEIIIVYFLCKKVGDILRGKGRNPTGYQVMAVIFWFGGEIFGAIVGVVVQVIMHGEGGAEGFNPLLYLFALVGAAVGAVLSLVIASVMPAVRVQKDYRDLSR